MRKKVMTITIVHRSNSQSSISGKCAWYLFQANMKRGYLFFSNLNHCGDNLVLSSCLYTICK